MFPLIKIMTQEVDHGVVRPKDYLNAAVQNFVLTLLISWTITGFYDPRQYNDHPVKPMIGNSNPCFGWDYPPASYIAVFMCSMNVYFTWRWAFLENARTKLQEKGWGTCVQLFAKFTAWNMAFASNLWLLLWMVGPADTNYTSDPDDLTWNTDMTGMLAWTIHILLFGLYCLSCFLALLGNFLEVRFSPRSGMLKWYHAVFVVIYGISVFYLLFVYMYAIMKYELGEPPATGSKWPTQIADLFWSFCTILMPYMSAPEIPLVITVDMQKEDAA